MYAIAIVRYRRPLDEVLPHVDAHRAYLRRLVDQGTLLASGPLEPRNGGLLLLRLPDSSLPDTVAALDALRDADPFVHARVAQYELWPWKPNVGAERLDQL